MRAPHPLKFLATFAVATASCYLAFLTAWLLLLEVPDILLAVFTPVEFEGVLTGWIAPRVLLRFPSDISPTFYTLSQSGLILAGPATLALGLYAARRSAGWLRVYLTQVLLWSSYLLALYASLFAVWAAGPFNSFVRSFWPSQAVSLGLRISVGVLVVGGAAAVSHLAYRHLLDSSADARPGRLLALARWLLLPATLLAFILTEQIFRSWRGDWTLRGSLLLGLVLFVLLSGLPAVLARPRAAARLRAGLVGAGIVLFIWAAVVGGLRNYDQLVRLAHRDNFQSHQSAYWRLEVEQSVLARTTIDKLAAQADQRLAQLANRLGLKTPNPALRGFFYTSTGEKRMHTSSDRAFTVLPARSEVHHLLTPDGEITDARGDALLLMHRAWGEPDSSAVARAVARYAVGNFHGAALDAYAARITREEGLYTLRDIFQLDTDYLSPLVCDALGGAWVDFLVRSRGQEILRVVHQESLKEGAEEKFARALSSSWEALERDWRSYLLAMADRRVPAPLQTRPEPFFHRGISFSHEIGRAWGYGSDRALEQLGRIRDLGANAIAIVPYAGTRAPRELTIRIFTGERDDRVIRTIQAAQARGLRIMLKPQLWGRGYTGDITFDNNADFTRWFSLYRRWLLHFARLAELYRVDVLVVGTELEGVTHREQEWRALIRDIRRIYSGPLTYAAHWGESFERLPFWDALDYLGLNMYYPLAALGEAPSADSVRLQELVEKFSALAKNYNKPVLFTEVGYPALRTAAEEPWKESSAALDAELQQRCYATIFEAFYHQPWFAGLYWWKWPSHGNGSPRGASFNPIGKPAADVLAHWYSQTEAR